MSIFKDVATAMSEPVPIKIRTMQDVHDSRSRPRKLTKQMLSPASRNTWRFRSKPLMRTSLGSTDFP